MKTTSKDTTGPLVTIGISTYNRVDFTLPEALRSALDQTYPRVEVVVCDNASTDGTERFMLAQRDQRLRYHRHEENIGSNGNFNACLERAQGAYFLLLHDDDLVDPTFVERAVAAMGRSEPGVLLGGVRLIDAVGNGVGRVVAPPVDLSPADLFMQWFGRRSSFYFCSTLFHTERLRSIGGFATPENLFQDVAAIARLASRFGYVAVPGVAGSFRQHEANHGAATRALSWARDAAHVLDVLAEELPADAKRLRAAGARYFTQTSYRYASKEPSTRQRNEAFRTIHELFGRTYAPWRYEIERTRRRLRTYVGDWLRRIGILHRRVV